MKNQLIALLKNNDAKGILSFLDPMSETERTAVYNCLSTIDIDGDLTSVKGETLTNATRADYYKKRAELSDTLGLAMLFCCRNKKEILQVTKGKDALENHIRHCLDVKLTNFDSVVAFFTKYPPDYLDAALNAYLKNRFARTNFTNLWILFENGWITFNEEVFVRSLFVVHMFDRNTVEDAAFLARNPAAFETVFLQFYKYELPVLDISKWNAKDGFVCAKVTTYWTEVLELLLESGIAIPRSLVKNLLASLLNNWKKPHLNWHISLLEVLAPTQAEYVAEQKLVFAFLNSDNLRTLNYAVAILATIHKEKDFDHAAFMASAPTLFIREKVDKTLAKLLPIVEYSLDKHPNLQVDIPAELSMGLLQVNTQTQAKFATLLVKFTPKAAIAAQVAPYTTVLKPKALAILGVDEQPALEELEFLQQTVPSTPTVIPSTWDDLLFHIGTCISTKTACDIDLFFEALVQLQDMVPQDYKKQLKPYLRQLNKREWEIEVMRYFSEFITNWSEENTVYQEGKTPHGNHLPFLKHKAKLAYARVSQQQKLPFLSTPTHLPFFVHIDVLVAKLHTYEEQNATVDLHDLIIAVNRTLPLQPSKTTVESAKRLKGAYSAAICYLAGGADAPMPDLSAATKEPLLALWAQVCRTKNPEGTYPKFLATKAAEIPTVVGPFKTDFKFKIKISGDWKWCYLILENCWNAAWYLDEDAKPKIYEDVYTYAAPNGVASRADIPYQISLLPNYVDAWLCRYIPLSVANNEVPEVEQCQYALQALLDYKLKVYHGGWLFIAQGLVFDKKLCRELAAEYIQFSLQIACIDEELLSKSLALMLTQKYAPVKRLTDYIEKVGHPKQVKAVHLKILHACIMEAELGNLPNSFKKIAVLYKEVSKELQTPEDAAVLNKLKSLKL